MVSGCRLTSGSVGGMASESDLVEIVGFIAGLSFHYTLCFPINITTLCGSAAIFAAILNFEESRDLYQLVVLCSHLFRTKRFLPHVDISHRSEAASLLLPGGILPPVAGIRCKKPVAGMRVKLKCGD